MSEQFRSILSFRVHAQHLFVTWARLWARHTYEEDIDAGRVCDSIRHAFWVHAKRTPSVYEWASMFKDLRHSLLPPGELINLIVGMLSHRIPAGKPGLNPNAAFLPYYYGSEKPLSAWSRACGHAFTGVPCPDDGRDWTNPDVIADFLASIQPPESLWKRWWKRLTA